MADWLFWAGVVAAVGAFLLSPLADFLPIDLWPSITSLFQGGEPHKYWRVIPAQHSSLYKFVVLGIGLVLIAAGYYLREGK